MITSSFIKRISLLVSIIVISVSLFAQNIPARPNPPRLVNDFSGVLSGEQKDILEHKLVALDDSTSNQIAIVLVKTLDDYAIEDYANKLYRSWGIGNKGTNNGVLIVAAIDDHKVRIEVGYGLEGAIPDITANSIIENDIVPSFKTQNFYQGLNLATDDLGKAASGEYHVQRKREDDNDDNNGGGIGFGIIIIIFIIIFIVSRRGGGGGRGGGMMSRSGYGGLGPLILGNLIGNALGGGSRGWGGGNSGGGWSGGGGGFGGFGGGSSGGGGASGSW